MQQWEWVPIMFRKQTGLSRRRMPDISTIGHCKRSSVPDILPHLWFTPRL